MTTIIDMLPNLARAKWAFSTRRVPGDHAVSLDRAVATARSGDLVLGRVTSVGQHARIQLPTGRYSALYPGDLVVMPCGARYAPDQFEGLAEIDPAGCQMLAGGGCLGRMVKRHEKMRQPTEVQPLGLLLDAEGRVLNTDAYRVPAGLEPARIPVVAVVGTTMNSGKTTATVALSHGLTRAGWTVGTLKGTGTGSFGDFNDYVDAGAHFVADFTDAGMVSTYLQPIERIKRGIGDLVAAAERAGCDVVVMELADGILQLETAALLADPAFRATLSGIVFACGDSVAASGGIAVLSSMELPILALTGLVSCSPMAAAEAQAATGKPVVTRAQLLDPAEANRIAATVGAVARERAA